MKRIIACLMAGVMLLALVGCGASGSSGSASSAAKKDYTQILHDARSDEDNKYEMIFTKGEDGKFTAQYGYSAEYEADQLSDEVANMMMPLLGLEDDMYDDFAASVSGMMVSVYGVAIVKPAEGKQARERHRESVTTDNAKPPLPAGSGGFFGAQGDHAARAFLIFSRTVSLSSQQTMTTSPVGTVTTRAAQAISYWSSRYRSIAFCWLWT